jgi:hypothetical protein
MGLDENMMLYSITHFRLNMTGFGLSKEISTLKISNTSSPDKEEKSIKQRKAHFLGTMQHHIFVQVRHGPESFQSFLGLTEFYSYPKYEIERSLPVKNSLVSVSPYARIETHNSEHCAKFYLFLGTLEFYDNHY